MLLPTLRFSFLPALAGAAAAALIVLGGFLAAGADEDPSVHVAAAPDPEELEIVSMLEKLYRSPHEPGAAYGLWADDLIDLMDRAIDSPLAPLVYRKIWELHSRCADPAPLDTFFETFVDREIPNGLLRQNALMDRRWALIRKGRTSEAADMDVFSSHARTALIVGPFGFGSAGLHDMVFPPEENFDLRDEYRGLGGRKVTWRILERSGTQAAFEPFTQMFPSGGCCFLLYQFHVPSARSGLLVLSHTGSAKAWCNDVLICDADRRKEVVPPQRLLPVELAAGWNRVLVKLSRSDTRVQLSVTSRSGFPMNDLSECRENVLHPVEGRSPLPAGEVDLSAIRPLEFVRLLLRRFPDSALLRTAAADLLSRRGDLSEALREARAAAAIDQESAHAAYFLGRLLGRCTYLPENYRNNRAREQIERALSLDPRFLPASLALARHDQNNDRSEEAVRSIQKILDESPRYYGARATLVDIFESLGWKSEWRDALVALEELAPDRVKPKEGLVLYHGTMGCNDRAIALLEKILDMDRSRTDVMDILADKILEKGDRARAASLCREILAHGDDGPTRRKLAVILAADGKTADALAVLEEACRRYPGLPGPLTDLAAFLLQQGNRDGAVSLYEAAIRIDPSLRRVRGLLSELDIAGYRDTLFREHGKKSADFLRDLPGKKEYPRASSICTLDQMITRVLPDGSSRSRIHQIFKILDEEAVETYGRLRVPGRTEILRTITPEGNILLPTDAEESAMFNMPGVDKGALVEVCFTIEQSHKPGTPMELGRFTFQDAGCSEPFLFSQLVVAIPHDLEIEEDLIIPERFKDDGRFERTVTRKGDDLIYVFTAREMPVVEKENFMPPDEEAFPNVDFVTYRTWDGVAQIMANTHFSRIFPRAEIDEKAAEVVDGATGDLEKAQRLYSFVNDLVKDDEGPDSAVRVLLERTGNRGSLFMALLDAAGVKYDYLRCGLRSGYQESDQDWSKISLSLLPGELIRLLPREGPGKGILVSMQSRSTAFGEIPPFFFSAPAMKVTGRAERLETLPGGNPAAYTEIRIAMKARVKGRKAEITGKATFPGFNRSNIQEGLRRLDAAQRRQFFEYQLLARSIHPGARVIDLEISGIDEPSAMPTFSFVIEVEGFVQPAGAGTACRLLPMPSNLTRAFIRKPTREFPLIFRGFTGYHYEMEVDLGGEYRIERLPKSLVEKSFFVNFSLLTRRTVDGFRVERILELNPADLPPAEYPAIIRILGAIDERELAPVMLEPVGRQ